MTLIFSSIQDADSLYNYATFLDEIRNDHKAAESNYIRAIDINPLDQDIIKSFANFLRSIGESSRGGDYYRKAVELGPKDAEALNSYAQFLKEVSCTR
jgi:protein O-mannosyl-transferase